MQFAEHIADPADSHYVQVLSREVGASLSYVQAMSGAAHVYTVSNLRDAAALTEVLQQLSARPDVIYAEQDRRVQKH